METERGTLHQIHTILTECEQGLRYEAEECGCFFNPDNGMWEVVVGCNPVFGDTERVLFRCRRDARCYFELMKLFGMKPDIRENMEGYIDWLQRSA